MHCMPQTCTYSSQLPSLTTGIAILGEC